MSALSYDLQAMRNGIQEREEVAHPTLQPTTSFDEGSSHLFVNGVDSVVGRNQGCTMRSRWLLFATALLWNWKEATSFSHGVAPTINTKFLNIIVAGRRRRRQRLSTVRADFSTKVFVEEIEKEGELGLERVPTTLSGAIQRFFFGPDVGPLGVVAILLGFVTWRGSLGSLGVADAAAFGGAVVFWWFQEHVLHQRVLHSEMDWMGKSIHETHHDTPYFHVSIDPAPLMIGWLLISHVLLRSIFPSTPLALSASLGYATAGLGYEWAHYVVHTKVRPTNPLWKRVRDNHMKHHLVDEQYWFSFSLPAMDDWFQTNPDVSAVQKAKAMEEQQRKQSQQQSLQ